VSGLSITPEDLTALQQGGTVRRAPAGEVLVREGAEAGSLFLVRSGVIAITRGAKRLGTVGAGDVLGQMALVHDGHRSASAIVEEDAELVVVPASFVRRLMEERPALQAALRSTP
jgi:CRP-like cAMP-binding protein